MKKTTKKKPVKKTDKVEISLDTAISTAAMLSQLCDECEGWRKKSKCSDCEFSMVLKEMRAAIKKADPTLLEVLDEVLAKVLVKAKKVAKSKKVAKRK